MAKPADHAASQGHGNEGHPTANGGDHITFTTIASTDTPFPTDPGSHFSGFGAFPSVDAKGEVAFLGFDANSNDQAIFVGDGDSFQFVVDLNTTLPGNPGPIERLFDPVIGNGDVAFVPNVLSGHPGVYVWHEGSLEVIADQHTVLPDGGRLQGVGNEIPSIDERENIAFVASSTATNDGGGGWFKDVNGTLTQVAGGPIGSGPQISNGHVVFNAGDISTDIGGKLHPVVNPPIAPDGGTFNAFGTVDISNTAIVFRATTTTGDNGIFLTHGNGGHVTEIAGGSTGSPIGQTNISHNTVAFTFGDNITQGIMIEHGFNFEQVIAAGDTLDGHTVATVQMGLQSLSGRYLTFEADFTDGSHGIYRADLHGSAAGGESALHGHSVTDEPAVHGHGTHHDDFFLI